MIPMRQIGQALVVYPGVSSSSDIYKKKTHTQWKIRRYKSTSLFQITVGYNQWCPRLHHKKRTSNSLKCIQYKQFPQYTQYKQFPQKEEKDEMEEKLVYFKRRKRGG